MAKSKIVQFNKKVSEHVTHGYQKIENGVTGAYKKVECVVVNGFNRITDYFVDQFLTQEGESIEQAKVRLQQAHERRAEKNKILSRIRKSDDLRFFSYSFFRYS